MPFKIVALKNFALSNGKTLLLQSLFKKLGCPLLKTLLKRSSNTFFYKTPTVAAF